MTGSWIKEFPGAVTVCDQNGIITEMNDRSCKMFEEDGGAELIGKNLLECHPEYARKKIKKMLEQPHCNSYSIEKNGRKKLVYQSP